MTTSELRTFLERWASKESWEDSADDCIIDDFAGGNVDDAFEGGFQAGKIRLAREILEAWEEGK